MVVLFYVFRKGRIEVKIIFKSSSPIHIPCEFWPPIPVIRDQHFDSDILLLDICKPITLAGQLNISKSIYARSLVLNPSLDA